MLLIGHCARQSKQKTKLEKQRDNDNIHAEISKLGGRAEPRHKKAKDKKLRDEVNSENVQWRHCSSVQLKCCVRKKENTWQTRAHVARPVPPILPSIPPPRVAYRRVRVGLLQRANEFVREFRDERKQVALHVLGAIAHHNVVVELGGRGLRWGRGRGDTTQRQIWKG